MKKLALLALFAAACLAISASAMHFAWPPIGFEASPRFGLASLALSAASALGVVAGAAVSVRKTGWNAANGGLLILGVTLVALGRLLYGYETRPF